MKTTTATNPTTADLKEMASNVYSCIGDTRRACRLLMRKTIEGMNKGHLLRYAPQPTPETQDPENSKTEAPKENIFIDAMKQQNTREALQAKLDEVNNELDTRIKGGDQYRLNMLEGLKRAYSEAIDILNPRFLCTPANPAPETHDSGNSKTEEPPEREAPTEKEAVKAIIDNKMEDRMYCPDAPSTPANAYYKYFPNVFLAKCPAPHNKNDVITLLTRYGKENKHIVYNLMGEREGFYYYSIIREDGFNAQERAQKKADKLNSWANSADRKSDEAYTASNKDREFLSMGEPIKIGHHSERGHRKMIEQAHNNMQKSVDNDEKAKQYRERVAYWEKLTSTINLSMPESLDFFKVQYAEAVEHHNGLKNGTIERAHGYSLTYAKNRCNDLKKKCEIAVKLWADKEPVLNCPDTPTRPAPKNKVAAIVTQQLIDRMKDSGKLPWRKPWTSEGVPQSINYVTRKAYKGINRMMLEPGEYLSFKQVQSAGGTIIKGRHAHLVIFSKPLFAKSQLDAEGTPKVSEDGTRERPYKFMLRYYNVFALEDVEGVESKLEPLNPLAVKIQPDAKAQAIIDNYIHINKGLTYTEKPSDRAYYSPSADSITVPSRGQYDHAAEFYSTNFHESAHSTGHEKRLARKLGTGRHSDAYSKEELVAEITAAFLCRECRLDTTESFNNSAAYIQGWSEKLANNENLIIIASAQAEKAYNYIMTDFDETTVKNDPEPEPTKTPEPTPEAAETTNTPEAIEGTGDELKPGDIQPDGAVYGGFEDDPKETEPKQKFYKMRAHLKTGEILDRDADSFKDMIYILLVADREKLVLIDNLDTGESVTYAEGFNESGKKTVIMQSEKVSIEPVKKGVIGATKAAVEKETNKSHTVVETGPGTPEFDNVLKALIDLMEIGQYFSIQVVADKDIYYFQVADIAEVLKPSKPEPETVLSDFGNFDQYRALYDIFGGYWFVADSKDMDKEYGGLKFKEQAPAKTACDYLNAGISLTAAGEPIEPDPTPTPTEEEKTPETAPSGQQTLLWCPDKPSKGPEDKDMMKIMTTQHPIHHEINLYLGLFMQYDKNITRSNESEHFKTAWSRAVALQKEFIIFTIENPLSEELYDVAMSYTEKVKQALLSAVALAKNKGYERMKDVFFCPDLPTYNEKDLNFILDQLTNSMEFFADKGAFIEHFETELKMPVPVAGHLWNSYWYLSAYDRLWFGLVDVKGSIQWITNRIKEVK